MRQRYPWGGAARLSRKTRGGRGYQAVLDDNGQQRGRAESAWVADMGVLEQVVEERPSYDRETGAYTGTSTYERPYQEAPGISPRLVAEVLDHAIFFSLGDLGKSLPRYEEIALPVDLDTDVYAEYDRTRERLKDYLIQRRWEGDTTFRGAFLQWAMGWPNAPFRPYEVIHHLKHPITGEKQPYTVANIPSYGEDRLFAKEQSLIDLVREELEAGRPCVVYCRQTATRDIQPRLERLLKRHVPGAQPFILKNTVEAERREKVIEAAVAGGCNLLLCNPELTKTGLDLIFAPTIIFYEITFNLSTMMQAAARSYRLNQTNAHCKVYYLFASGTMEQTAVQLMSRKQRAAKLLTGDVGLTGLDALTEGEGGFEQALLDAIGRDETLLDPTALFKAEAQVGELDQEDAAYWNVEDVSLTAEMAINDEPDALITAALDLGATITPVKPTEHLDPVPERIVRPVEAITAYLETVHIVSDETLWTQQRGELLALLDGGTADGIAAWLSEQRIVFPGFEREVAGKLVTLARVQTDSTPALHLVTPSRAKTVPKRQRERSREPLVFPRREAVPEEAFTQQMALF